MNNKDEILERAKQILKVESVKNKTVKQKYSYTTTVMEKLD